MRHFPRLWLIILCVWLSSATTAAALEKPLIAVVMANSQPRYKDIHRAFTDTLQASCGTECRIYVQRPNADTMSLRNSVRKAVALGAKVIVTYGPAAALAAQAETHSIPTLFADVYDPVGLKLVSAKKLTGRNMTGIRGDAPLQTLLKYFLDATDARHLAVLYDRDSPEANLQRLVLQEQGEKKGVTVTLLPVSDLEAHAAALQELPDNIDGLFLANSEHSGSYLEDAIGFADARQIPVFTQRAGASEVGAFMVLETSAAEQGEKVAELVKSVLAGQKTQEIKMERPHEVEFVVNLKAAKRCNVNVPFQTLSVVSRVVR